MRYCTACKSYHHEGGVVVCPEEVRTLRLQVRDLTEQTKNEALAYKSLAEGYEVLNRQSEAMRKDFESILLRCTEGSKESDWLPIIANISRRWTEKRIAGA